MQPNLAYDLAHPLALRRWQTANVVCWEQFGAWRSPVARLLWEQEVPGSNPGAPTTYGPKPRQSSRMSGASCTGVRSVILTRPPHGTRANPTCANPNPFP